MKRIYLLMVALFGLFSFGAVAVHAEAVNNDVKVTTKNGKSTVCINGKCTNYEGNVEVITENGKTSVKVKSASDGGTMPTVNKEVDKQKEAIKKQLDKAKTKQQEIQEKIKQPFDLWMWIQSEIEAIKKQFPFLPI